MPLTQAQTHTHTHLPLAHAPHSSSAHHNAPDMGKEQWRDASTGHPWYSAHTRLAGPRHPSAPSLAQTPPERRELGNDAPVRNRWKRCSFGWCGKGRRGTQAEVLRCQEARRLKADALPRVIGAPVSRAVGVYAQGPVTQRPGAACRAAARA